MHVLFLCCACFVA